MIDDILDTIYKLKEKKNIGNVIWKSIYVNEENYNKKDHKKKMGILIINGVCNGFGDLIFALKLSNYLKEWYNAEVTIATPLEKELVKLGADPKYVVGLTKDTGEAQCSRFKTLKLNKSIPKQDLLLIAPLTIDHDFKLRDVQYIIPYANVFNTFSFSEYNDSLKKNFTFNTGVGKNRDGIFLTHVGKSSGRVIKNPYALVYVAKTLNNVDRCILSFVEMICKKYHKTYDNLDIIIPPWFSEIVNGKIASKISNKIGQYYPNIYIKTKDVLIKINEDPDKSPSKTLTFRCDILPVPNKEMINIIQHSIKDILVTGDQSITDVLSCCSDKNIWYQIAPWKSDFAKNLAIELPDIYYKSVKTSCGTMKALRYTSHYDKFIRTWDFRSRAKDKLDAIVLSILYIKNDEDVAELADIILNTRSLASIKKKLVDF